MGDLKGTWEVVEATEDGQSVPPDKIKEGIKFVFGNQKLSLITFDGKKEEEYRISFGGQQTPRAIDLIDLRWTKLGKITPCIYELKDDSLRICLPLVPRNGTKQRPTSFRAEQGSNLISMTLKRFTGVLSDDTLAALATEPDAKQEAVIAAIARWGGSVKRDTFAAGEPAVALSSDGKGPDLTDENLELLAGLPHLKKLDVGHPNLTDASLAHIGGLVELQELDFFGRITDAGLKNLEGLKAIRKIALPSFNLTDGALSHLKMMSELQELHLNSITLTGTGGIAISCGQEVFRRRRLGV